MRPQDGAESRRLNGNRGGTAYYRMLRKAGFPNRSAYRVLCCNCNHALGAYGYCPHMLVET